MTPQTTEQTALDTAQRQLLQARENDQALNPKPRVVPTLGELVGSGGGRSAVRFPTAAHVRALATVRSMPRFMEAFHAEHCSGGMVVILVENGEFEPVRCPRCEHARREGRLRAQMAASGIEGRYLDVEWADLELLPPLNRVAERSRDILALIEAGASLLLYGEETGSGKTQAAMLCAKAAIRAGRSAHVTNLARLALEVRESYRGGDEGVTEKAALLRLTGCDLLVIDDLGAGESDTAAVERRLLFLALDERQMRRLPTIVTTNLLLAPPRSELDGGRKDPNRAPTLVEVVGARVLARLQPLKTLHVNHGVNFRTRGSEVGW